MKKYKYIGTFIDHSHISFELEVYCDNFEQAYFLLNADAIRSGKGYNLNSIEDENGHIKYTYGKIDINNIIY